MANDDLTSEFDTSQRERRLDEVLASYVEAAEAGQPPDREAMLIAHPDLAEELRAFFANRDGIEQAMGAVRREPPRGVLPKLRYFGDYELLEEVARGGMGIVYKARQTSLNRIVAVKMILAGQLATVDDVRRFRIEAEAAANLQHPNIVAVHEVGIHENQHYFSMEFVEGQSLAALVRENPLPARRAAAYVQTIARAVHYAHQEGTLHRDLKPSNVLLDTRDQVRITDFGLATRITNDHTLTQSGQVLGTPSYMAPEQAAGKRALVGPAADIYSLGVILYELLTGRPPFRAESAVATLHQVMHVEPASPRLLNPHIPRDLETICLKCLQKEPHKRYGTAELLADDLRRYLAGEPIHARPIGRAQRLWRWSRRNPLVAGLAAAVALVLVAGTAVSTYFAIEADALAREESLARGEAEVARNSAEQSQKKSTAESRRAYRNYYVAQMNLAQRDWEQGDLKLLRQRLDETQPPQTGDVDLRGFEWWYWKRQSEGGLLTLDETGGQPRSLAFSPDGLRLATANLDGRVKIWDAVSGREMLNLKGFDHNVLTVAFSPDGQRLAAAAFDGPIRIWETAQGEETLVLKGHAGAVGSVAFSPDGQRLASGGNDKSVKVWDLTSGQETLTLMEHTDNVASVAFSPDGRLLASASELTLKVWDATSGELKHTLQGRSSVAFSQDGTLASVTSSAAGFAVMLWDPAAGRPIRSLRGHPAPIRSITFPANGQRLAAAIGNNTVTVWDARGAQRLSLQTGRTASVAFNPDGRRVATASVDSPVKLWDSTSEQNTLTLKGHAGTVYAVAFCPKGRRLASGGIDQSVRIWDAASGRETLSLPGHSGYVTSVAFSPDGRQVASASWDKTVKLWDAASGQEAFTLEGHTEKVMCVTYSRDGRRLASAGGDGVVRIWDPAAGQETLTLKGPADSLRGVAFSPDGRRLASAGDDRKVTVWDANSGEELLTLKGHTAFVSSVMFAPQGERLASASGDGSVKIWDAASGEEILTLKGHASMVKSVAFSPDGRRLASASDDNSITVWDAESGQEMLTLTGHITGVQSIAFSLEGGRLASASYDGTVKVWDARPWTAELRAEYEARTLLTFLASKVKSAEEMLELLHADQTINAAVREQSLSWAALHYRKFLPDP